MNAAPLGAWIRPGCLAAPGQGPGPRPKSAEALTDRAGGQAPGLIGLGAAERGARPQGRSAPSTPSTTLLRVWRGSSAPSTTLLRVWRGRCGMSVEATPQGLIGPTSRRRAGRAGGVGRAKRGGPSSAALRALSLSLFHSYTLSLTDSLTLSFPHTHPSHFLSFLSLSNTHTHAHSVGGEPSPSAGGEADRDQEPEATGMSP